MAGTAKDKPGDTRRVFLLAVDGLEWRIVRRGAAAGWLPNLKSLVEAGAWAEVPIRECVPGLGGWAELDLNSPTLWTTIATGQYYFRHGVFDFRNRLESFAQPPLFGARHVRSARIWDVLTHYDIPSLVVGYYVTHPAYPIRGVMVSDLFGEAADGAAFPRSRLDEFAVAAGAESYAALVKQLGRLASEGTSTATAEPLEPASRELARSALAEFTSLSSRAIAALLDEPSEAERRRLVEFYLLHPLLRDERMHAVMRDLLARENWRFATAYYRLPDYVAHTFWYEDQSAPELWRGFEPVLERAYRRFDRQLGEIRAALPGDSALIVVSDHGFGAGPGPGDESNGPWRWSRMGKHAEPGVLIVTGGGRTGRISEPVSLLDLAPSILNHLGVPLAETLDGGVVPGLLSADAAQSQPRVADYPFAPPVSGDDLAPEERARIETRLAALGYIE